MEDVSWEAFLSHSYLFTPFRWPCVAVLPMRKEALLPLEVRTFISTLPTVPKYWSWTPKNITLTQGAYQNADSVPQTYTVCDSEGKTEPKNLHLFICFYGTSPFFQFIDEKIERRIWSGIET